MSAVMPGGHGEPLDHQNPAKWDRTHFGVVVPLCLVVVVAIVCIVVAALTSAHRADEVALDNEKHLLIRAITTPGEWSLRRLRSIIAIDGRSGTSTSMPIRNWSRAGSPASSSRCKITI